MLKKIVWTISFLALSIVFLLAAKPTWAGVRCETQYGGAQYGEVCVRTGQLQIDKEVFNPQENKFVDNLGLTSHKFNPGDEVIFKLQIKNVGDAAFDKVSVDDSLPSLLERTLGDLSFEIRDLTPGEVEVREIKTKVVSSNQFPEDKTVVCVINTAGAVSGNERDKDTSQICLERKVLGAAIQPATGPEEWVFLLSLSIFAGLAGLSLKLSKAYFG